MPLLLVVCPHPFLCSGDPPRVAEGKVPLGAACPFRRVGRLPCRSPALRHPCRWPGVWSGGSRAPARTRPHPSLVSSRMSLPVSCSLSWHFGHLFPISWCGPCPPRMMLPQALLSLRVSTLGFLFGSVPATASFMVASLEPAALEMEQMKVLRETLGKRSAAPFWARDKNTCNYGGWFSAFQTRTILGLFYICFPS